MSILNKNRASSRELIKQLVNKTKKVKKETTVTKKGGSLIVRIKNICDLVQKRLGHYEDQLELIQTKERLHEYIDACIANNIIAIDTETTGLDPITDQIVGACIYTYEQKPAYIPINHVSYITNARLENQLTEKEVAEEFQRLVDKDVKIIMFNAKFDVRVIRHQLGVYMKPAWCGFIAGKCLKNNELEGNLKYLWKKYCSNNKEEAHFTFDKMFENIKFNLIPISTAYLYAAKDALMTLDLYDFQKPYLTEDDPNCIECGFQKLAKLYREIELPIIPIVADIEDTGVAIDVNYCKGLSEKYNNLLQDATKAFHTELLKYKDQIDNYRAKHPDTKLEDPINIASSTQLAELFYDVLQVQPVSRKQPRGTGEDILEKMGHPLGKLILNYRGVAKLLNTYIDKMPSILNSKTGRIHCSFNQYGTDCLSGDILVHTDQGLKTIESLCKDITKESGVYYPLEINIINRYNEVEKTSHCVMFENVKVKRLDFSDGTYIEGTLNHPILCNNEWIELKDIELDELVDSCNVPNSLKVINVSYDCKTVYDFKVPRTHSFKSNNVISHNTGRFSCISKGTKISMPGGDRNIEDVKPGDYVYSYSDEGKLQLNKVKNSWCTGKKKCVKIYWLSKYNRKSKGTLICTPDHYLKTYKGWKQAQDLTPEDSIYFVHRKELNNCVYLSASFKQGNNEEHVWIRDNFFKAKKGICIHHKDTNRLNNDPNNLQICTKKEHINIHREMKNGYCGAYDFTKEQVIKICEEVDWDIRKSKYDYESLKNWLKYYKINYIKEYSDCYDTRPTTMRASGKSFKYKSLPLIEENLKYALELANNNIDEAASYFGENSSKFVSACHKYELLPNHNVYKIEILEEDYDVYDLEIENAHNFIANELCVHNSSNPNLQNIPSHNKDIRPMFIGSKNKNIETQGNIFNLLYCDKVQTLNGKKYSQDLQVGDVLICKEGNYEIKNINIDGNNIRVEI